MMKKYVTVGVLLAMLVAPTAFAQKEIVKVEIAVAGGVSADYDALTGTLKWSMGASGLLIDADGNYYVDENINVVGQFSNVVDTSSGGQAMANFALDSVTLTFNSIQFPSLTGATSQGILKISPYNNNRYWESEIAPNADVLNGHALVSVVADFVLEPVWGSTHHVVWNGSNPFSSLDALISLPVGTDIQSYLEDYSSDNNMIVLTAVPEPCTIALLSLGGLLLRKRLV